MTAAQDQIAAVSAWLAASSVGGKSPLGDMILRGPYATIASVSMDESPHPNFETLIAQGVLPLLTPQAQPAPIDLSPPESQDRVTGRALHLIWKVTDGALPPVVIVGLPAQTTTIRDALTAAGLGSLDLAARGVLAFVCLHGVTAKRICAPVARGVTRSGGGSVPFPMPGCDGSFRRGLRPSQRMRN